MKTFAKLFAVLAFLAVGFTGCSDDDDDAAKIDIHFNQSGNFNVGDAVTGVITSADENLTRVLVFLNGNAVKTYTSFNSLPIQKGDKGVYSVFISDLTTPGDYTLRAESKTGESSAKFTIINPDNPNPGKTDLDAATNFEWKRVGGAAATGLSEFGLTWTQNSKVTHAQIRKGNAAKLVDLGSSAWTSITTKEDLKAAVDNASDMAVYDKVSAEANGTHDDVLGVSYNQTYYMIHVTTGTVVTGTSGTTITILGNYKK